MIVDLARRLSHRMTQAGGLIVLVTALVVTVDVVLRQVFRAPLGGIEELSGYGLAIATTWGLSDAFLRRTHIRIDVFYQLVPVGARAVLDVVSLLALLATIAYLGWLAFNMFLLAVEFKSRTAQPLFFPLAIIQGMWVAGILVFIAVMSVVAAAVARELARGNLAAVQQLLSPAAASEELAEELASIEKRRAGSA